MKISRQWLREFVDFGNLPVEDIGERLTMAGLEVEGQERFAYEFPHAVVVGEILDVQRHPQADGLFVCQVHVGEAQPRTIVCGAPNTVAHVKVPIALPGAILPTGVTVQEAVIRGTASAGMICAEDEIGFGDDHSGIWILPADLPVGTPLTRDLFALEPDVVLEVSLTPNRGDCLSHLGIAREVATLLDCPCLMPPVSYPEEARAISELAAVVIERPDLCSRYTASVITDVTIGASPLWLRKRLERLGLRSINNVVDVTNLVMMELGQPLHAFDLNLLAGSQIIVRSAQLGERFTTLDGVERQLDDAMLMIADAERNVGIAGVMGGQNSEVSAATTAILLESAYFNPSNIRKTSKKLGLSTEASYRFERSIDLLNVAYALRRATRLIVELTGGKAAKGIIDLFPAPLLPRQVVLRWTRVSEILGITIEQQTITSILTNLGFRILQSTSQQIEVEVPSYRADIEREIDLIEELGRIYGYDNILTVLPSGEIPPKIENRRFEIECILRDSLLSMGLHEVINYSFSDPQHLEKLGVAQHTPYRQVVVLRNPLTAEQGVMRTTTIAGLLENVKLNVSNRNEDLRFFEIGKVFFATEVPEALPQEHFVVSGILTGQRWERGWAHTVEMVNFYDAKGVIENMFAQLALVATFQRTEQIPFLHPGEAAAIMLADETVGVIGKLHPDTVEAFNLKVASVYVFELFIEPLTRHALLQKRFQSLPKFPAVHRDLALMVPDTTVQAADVERIITETGMPLLEHVFLFDRYAGHQIEAGYVGLTYSLRYRSLEKTLTDREVSEVQQRIIDHLQDRLGVRLRS